MDLYISFEMKTFRLLIRPNWHFGSRKGKRGWCRLRHRDDASLPHTVCIRSRILATFLHCYIAVLLHCWVTLIANLFVFHCYIAICLCYIKHHCCTPLLYCYISLHICFSTLQVSTTCLLHFSRPLTLGYCNYAALLGELSLITWCCICLFLNICMIQNVWQCFMWHLPSYKVALFAWCEMQHVQSVSWWPVTLARCILQKLLLVCLSLHRLLPYMWHPASYMRHCAHCILPYM